MKALDKIIYVQSPGHFIGIEKKQLYISDKNSKRAYFNTYNIDALVIGEASSITSAALQRCADEGINVVFNDWSGRFKCRIEGDKNKNIFVRKSQILLVNQKELSLKIAKDIVRQKIKSMHKVYPFKEYRDILHKIRDVKIYEGLLGIEGSCSKQYFSNFRRESEKLGFSFPRRSFHPPLDAMNSLLSLAYSMLNSEILVILHIFGLDPAFGFLHRDYYGRDSFVCDVMEPFRSIIADQYVLYAIDNISINQSMFKETKKGILFDNYEAKKSFFKLFRTKYFTDKLRRPIFDFVRKLYDIIIEEGKDLRLLITKDSSEDVA